jgi:hypothetical protein
MERIYTIALNSVFASARSPPAAMKPATTRSASKASFARRHRSRRPVADAGRFVALPLADAAAAGFAVFGTNSEANSMSVDEMELLEALVRGRARCRLMPAPATARSRTR